MECEIFQFLPVKYMFDIQKVTSGYFRSNDNLQVVIHSKNGWDPINIDDRHGYEEFILIADKLFHNDLRKLTSSDLSRSRLALHDLNFS